MTDKEKSRTVERKSGGLYRNLNVSVRLLDGIIIGGLMLIAFVIMASASV